MRRRTFNSENLGTARKPNFIAAVRRRLNDIPSQFVRWAFAPPLLCRTLSELVRVRRLTRSNPAQARAQFRSEQRMFSTFDLQGATSAQSGRTTDEEGRGAKEAQSGEDQSVVAFHHSD